MIRRLLHAILTPLGLAAAVLGPPPAPAQTSCLAYEAAPVSLQGTLRLAVFPGPPHYRSFESGDAPQSVWLLHLEAPVCIAALAEDLNPAARVQVDTVQIVPRTGFGIALNGAAARVEGTLARAGAHAHAAALLQATRVQPAQRAP